jgi:hypothetical protein
MHQKGFTVINNGSRENKSERDIAADGFIVSDGQFHLYSLLGRFKQARKETSFVTQERKEISSRINSTLGSCSIFTIFFPSKRRKVSEKEYSTSHYRIPV